MELDVKRAVTMEDLGDCVDYLMPNGAIASPSWAGNCAIYEAKQP
jgi:hypothetical protein